MAGYQIKVTIENTHPPVWRRLFIPNRITFGQLHRILQVVFGWTDFHLHAFDFQYIPKGIEAASPMEFEDGEDREENQILVDEYLKDGWIRYTYDFGDDWRHKIVLEKEIPDNDSRFASVIKFKGNNFEEDCGWDFIEADPYDMEQVNKILEQYHCPIGEIADIDETYDWNFDKFEKAMAEELGMNFNDVMDMLGQFELEMNLNSTKQTKLEKKLEPVINLREELEESPNDYSFYRKGTDKTQLDLLKVMSNDELFNVLNYLDIPHKKNWNKTKKAQAIIDCLKEHPEYYGIIFDSSTLEGFRDLDKAKDKFIPKNVTNIEWDWLVVWGLMDLDIDKITGTVGVALTEEAQVLRTWLETQNIKIIQHSKESTMAQMIRLLISYGCIEKNKFGEQYMKLYPEDSYREVQKYLYLDGVMKGKVDIISENDSPREYFALQEIDALEALERMREYGEGLDYAEFSAERVDGWNEGFIGFCPIWYDFVDILLHMYELEEYQIQEIVEVLYMKVVEGESIIELMDELMDYFEDEAQSYVFIPAWVSLVECWSQTGIISLKGHTRAEIAKKRKISILAVAQEEYISEQGEGISPYDSFWELPHYYQDKILKLFRDNSDNPITLARKLERLNRELKLEDMDDLINMLKNC